MTYVFIELKTGKVGRDALPGGIRRCENGNRTNGNEDTAGQ